MLPSHPRSGSPRRLRLPKGVAAALAAIWLGLSVWLSPGGLSVGAAPDAERDLGTCEDPPEIAPEGAMQWRLETVTFAGALRALLRMRLYGEHTFRRHTEKSIGGGCRRMSGVGERSCVAYTTVVVVRRIG